VEVRVRGALRVALTFLAASSVTFAGAAFADNNQVIVKEQYGKYGGTDLSVTQDTNGDDNLISVEAQKATGEAELTVNQSGSSNTFEITTQSSAGDFANDDASSNHNNSISASQSGDDTISKQDITAIFTQGGSNTVTIGTQEATDGSIDLSVTQNSGNTIEINNQVAGDNISSTITQDSSNNEIYIQDSEAGVSITDQITQSGTAEAKLSIFTQHAGGSIQNTITQDGSDTGALKNEIDIVSQIANGDIVNNISQLGDENKVNIQSQSSTNGNINNANIEQNGNGNDMCIGQTATNDIDNNLKQDGDDNELILTQMAMGGAITNDVTFTGNSNKANIQESASNGNVNLSSTVDGNNNNINLNQNSFNTGNVAATINITGSHNQIVKATSGSTYDPNGYATQTASGDVSLTITVGDTNPNSNDNIIALTQVAAVGNISYTATVNGGTNELVTFQEANGDVLAQLTVTGDGNVVHLSQRSANGQAIATVTINGNNNKIAAADHTGSPLDFDETGAAAQDAVCDADVQIEVTGDDNQLGFFQGNGLATASYHATVNGNGNKALVYQENEGVASAYVDLKIATDNNDSVNIYQHAAAGSMCVYVTIQ